MQCTHSPPRPQSEMPLRVASSSKGERCKRLGATRRKSPSPYVDEGQGRAVFSFVQRCFASPHRPYSLPSQVVQRGRATSRSPGYGRLPVCAHCNTQTCEWPSTKGHGVCCLPSCMCVRTEAVITAVTPQPILQTPHTALDCSADRSRAVTRKRSYPFAFL